VRHSPRAEAIDSAPASDPPAVAPNSDLPGTILSLQALRFVAALCVVVFHSHVALLTRFPGHQPDQVDHAFNVGASGVHIFFVISGFVMVYTTLRSGLTPWSFLLRRLIRIYPIYWVMVAAYLVAHVLLGTPYTISAADAAGAAVLLPGYSSLVIGPGWTLSFEMYFYLCFAVTLFAGLRRGIIVLSIFYFVSVLIRFSGPPHSAFGQLATDSLLLEFMTGAWLGYAYARGFRLGVTTGSALVVLALLLFVAGFWFDYNRVPSVVSWGVPSFLFVAGALGLEPKMNSGIGKHMAKLGDSSYLLYLAHVLILDLLIATPLVVIDRDKTAAILFAFPAAAICTAGAAFGYKLVELPLLRLMKRWLLRPSKPRLEPSAA
jgi:exopolysaccharide production protein ExoZ